MKVEKVINSPTNVTIKVDVDQELIDQYYQRSLKKLKSNLNLPGFRKGNVPNEIALKNIDAKLLEAEFFDEIIDFIFRRVIQEQNLSPVSKPNLTVQTFVPYSRLEVNFTFDIIGQIQLPDLKSLKSNVQPAKVTAQELNQAIKDYQFNVAKRQKVSRASKLYDEIEFNFKGYDEKNQLIEGASADNYFLVIGSKKFIPGFEEELIGLKPGQNKTFQLTFPEDYFESSLRGKKVRFDIEVKSITELELPELNDDFAKKVGSFKDLTDFKSALKNRLLINKESQVKEQIENDLIQQLIDQSRVEIPESLIDNESQHFLEDLKKQLQNDNKTMDEFLQSQGLSLEQYQEDRKKMIIQQIKTGLILSEIANQNNISIGEDEFNQQLNLLKSTYKDDSAMLEQLQNPSNITELKNRLLIQKILNYLVEVTKS